MSDDENLSPEMYTPEEVPVKRGRGRPPKTKISTPDFFQELRNNEPEELPEIVVDVPENIEEEEVILPNIPNNFLFSEKGTEILGAGKRQLLQKIAQYKFLFPDELKHFTIKKDSSVEKLQEYLDEIEVIIQTGTIEMFLLDGILHSIKEIELSTESTSIDVTGLADSLKSNPEFSKVCRLIFVKYSSFAKCPPEVQAIFIIVTSAYVCINNNRKKRYADILDM